MVRFEDVSDEKKIKPSTSYSSTTMNKSNTPDVITSSSSASIQPSVTLQFNFGQIPLCLLLVFGMIFHTIVAFHHDLNQFPILPSLFSVLASQQIYLVWIWYIAISLHVIESIVCYVQIEKFFNKMEKEYNAMEVRDASVQWSYTLHALACGFPTFKTLHEAMAVCEKSIKSK